jgi:pre-mRNA-splicing factor SYF1
MDLFDDTDMPYEEECMRNPYNVKSWLRYIEHKTKTKNYKAIYLVYERALKLLSGSYKIWYKYLVYRRNIVKLKPINDIEYDELNNVYERALAFMHKVNGLTVLSDLKLLNISIYVLKKTDATNMDRLL